VKHRAPLIVQEYSARWPVLYEEERSLLLRSLPAAHFQVEHIGSTAVPGLPSKPIVDMMLGAWSLSLIDAQLTVLQNLGYEYMPQHELEIPDRRFFAKPVVRPRTVHLHGLQIGGSRWNAHLKFRNQLRASPELSERYASLKKTLAAQFKDDRAAYTEAKSTFIQGVLAAERGEA
jgi:GrpB-like predicted nucleotidyltransferase (UPF0157 family)